MSTEAAEQQLTAEQAPHPGSQRMPRWKSGKLDDAPAFRWSDWTAMIGPGLIMAGAAIGGGEWLMGPAVTARYGATILWITLLSVLFQVVYNMEVSRYALYTGEPVVVGKFRTLPGPIFWLAVYIVLDFGSIFPYLASNAAIPIAAMWLGKLPEPVKNPDHQILLRWISYGVLTVALLPLLFGGKIYNALRAIMFTKVVFVLGFLAFIAIFYSSAKTWIEIATGFFHFGTIPIGDGQTANVFQSLWNGNGFPSIDEKSIGLLASFAAIAGVGGLSQMSLSNYTRDQGWGMGKHVGAIPSLIGGHKIELSHEGTVFTPNEETMPRWRRWYRHVLRDQLVVWMPACIIGLALPSMLSLEFLPRGTVPNDWTIAGMTADATQARVGGTLGSIYWYVILFCGFLVLTPSTSSTADGFVRRWLELSWTGLPSLRKWEPHRIKYLYVGFISIYYFSGLFLLSIGKPATLVLYATNLMNFALGFSSWHVLYVNTTLLPRQLRPGMFARVGLFLSGTYFLTLAVVTAKVTFFPTLPVK